MASYIRNTSNLLRNSFRSLATIAPSATHVTSTSSSSSTLIPPAQAVVEHEGPLRPHLRIPVNPNHGLYGFFRVKTDKNSHSKPREDGQPEYVALEVPGSVNSGRAWNAAELRRKSFKDLHTLWYVLLRERNLLATQGEEKRKVKFPTDLIASQKSLSCRKSMARIKAVISERRYAYQNAIQWRRTLSRHPELSVKNVESTSGSGENMFESEADRVVAEKTP